MDKPAIDPLQKKSYFLVLNKWKKHSANRHLSLFCSFLCEFSESFPIWWCLVIQASHDFKDRLWRAIIWNHSLPIIQNVFTFYPISFEVFSEPQWKELMEIFISVLEKQL